MERRESEEKKKKANKGKEENRSQSTKISWILRRDSAHRGGTKSRREGL